jgi:hypothetical protein
VVLVKATISGSFIHTREEGCAIIESMLDDAVEVAAGEWPDGGLRAP